jgi:hypothetical protein
MPLYGIVWGTSINFDSTLLEKEPALRYEELNRKLVFWIACWKLTGA